MIITDFINKALAGGWKNPQGDSITATKTVAVALQEAFIYRVLLDPTAWVAVGKTEGWKPFTKVSSATVEKYEIDVVNDTWLENMHKMIDALSDGKSIEQFISTL